MLQFVTVDRSHSTRASFRQISTRLGEHGDVAGTLQAGCSYTSIQGGGCNRQKSSWQSLPKSGNQYKQPSSGMPICRNVVIQEPEAAAQMSVRSWLWAMEVKCGMTLKIT